MGHANASIFIISYGFFKAKTDFYRTGFSFVCHTEKRDPQFKFRKNVPLFDIGNSELFKQTCKFGNEISLGHTI